MLLGASLIVLSFLVVAVMMHRPGRVGKLIGGGAWESHRRLPEAVPDADPRSLDGQRGCDEQAGGRISPPPPERGVHQ